MNESSIKSSENGLREFLRAGEQAGARYRFASLGRTPQGTAGTQLARTAGESMEFMEHRDYQPGDDLRRMNWSAYARSDKLVVKVFRQEVCPHFDLIIDGSRSMDLEGTDKLAAALGLSAALSCAAENSGYSRRVFLTQEGCHPVRGGTDRPPAWQGLEFSSPQNPADAFRIQLPRLRPHGVRVLVSDLLWLGNPMDVLNPLSDRSAATLVLQVLAREDVDPGQTGNHRLVDRETGTTLDLMIDRPGLERYQSNLNRHQQAWRSACRQLGATFISLVAEDVCHDWDLSALVRAEILTM